jgi:hypothetical protein
MSRGVSKLTFLIFGTIVFVAVYSSFKIGAFYYGFYDLKAEMESMIKVAPEISLRDVHQRLMVKVNDNQLPLTLDDFKISKADRFLSIEVKYVEVFYIELWDKTYDIYSFPFHAFVETDVR